MRAFREIAAELRASNNLRVKFYVSNRIQEGNGYHEPPALITSEIVVKEAQKVLLFPNPIDKAKGLMGNLYITNFRIFLVPTDGADEREPPKQKNLLLGDYGICLTNVDAVYQVSGGRVRKLQPTSNLEGRIKCLQIVCKNMRVLTLNFEQSSESGKTIATTILHHAFVGRHPLLFAYEYSAPMTPDEMAKNVQFFYNKEDWLSEIKRTCRDTASLWRVSCVNKKFVVSMAMSEYVVVPHTITDGDLTEMCRSFRSDRPPAWTWSHVNGAALVRMADCLPAIIMRTQENKFLENLRGLHPHKRAPVMMELDKCLPSVRDIQNSFIKLRDICIPVSKRQFESQDNRFYSLLDNCKWMHYVSYCLKQSVAAAKQLGSGISVVLQENEGRDTSALVASLIQVMLDANSRTISGFQSLIQKEWVSLGHPFCSRLGLLRHGNEQSPVFLLFLDCIWQIQQQFPSAFEFNGIYLTTLFDSCHTSLFDTFLFDCTRDRQTASESEDRFKGRPIWWWHEQFNEDDIALFFNPLYQLEDILDHRSPRKSLQNVLPNHEIWYLEPWGQCYFRWLPALGIRQGGQSKIDVVNVWLRREVNASIEEMKQCSKRTPLDISRRILPCNQVKCVTLNETLANDNFEGSILESISNIDSFYPFSNCDNSILDLLSDSSRLSECDSQSMLNLTE